MKKTAVEFIIKGLFDILQEAENNNILEIGTQNFKRYIEMFEKQAKAMEKQRLEQFYNQGYTQCSIEDLKHTSRDRFVDAEDYYNETFKSE